MKRLFYSIIIGALVSTLALGAEVRKLGEYDLSWGPFGTTWTSPAGKEVRYLPRYFDNNAFADNTNLYGKSLTGDGTGSITGFNIPLYLSNFLSIYDALTASWEDARMKGAMFDNSVDSSSLLQASINALDNGTHIKGVIYLPKGIVRASNLSIGDGTKKLEIIIKGEGAFEGPNLPGGISVIYNPSSTDNTFNMKFDVNKSNYVKFTGLTIIKPTGSTGDAFFFDGVSQPVGFEWENITVFGGNGINYTAGSLLNTLRRVTFYGTTNYGINFQSTNLYGHYDEVVFQSGLANGVLIQTAGEVGYSKWNKCLFENNAGADTKLMGRLILSNFTSCGWEYPGSDMFWIAPGSTGLNNGMIGIDFFSCIFDGSSGVGGRNVINNTTAIGDYVGGDTIGFYGGGVYNLNGGYVLKVPQNPQDGSYPYYKNITVEGSNAINSGGPFNYEGILPIEVDATQISVFKDKLITDNNIITGFYGTKPSYILVRGNNYIVNATKVIFPYTSTPDNSAVTCTKGQQSWDNNYKYWCASDNTWRRASGVGGW